MKFAAALRVFFQLFHCAGVSSIRLLPKPSPSEFGLAKCGFNPVPTIIWLISCASVTYISFRITLMFPLSSPTDYFLYIIYKIVLVFSIFAIGSYSIFRRKKFFKLMQRLQLAENIIAKRIRIDYAPFVRDYMLKISIVCLLFVLYILIATMINPGRDVDMYMNLCISVYTAVILLACFQSLFYVLLFAYLLSHLVKCVTIQAATVPIERTNVRCYSEKQFCREMIYIKLAHYNLWKVARSVNKIFGWQIGLYLQLSTINIVYCVYFMMIFFVSDSSTYSLRNYLLLHSCLFGARGD